MPKFDVLQPGDVFKLDNDPRLYIKVDWGDRLKGINAANLNTGQGHSCYGHQNVTLIQTSRDFNILLLNLKKNA